MVVFVNTKAPLSLKNPGKINEAIKALFKQGNVNHVFAVDGLVDLQKGLLERLVEGKATIYSDTYAVLANEHHGIPDGNVVHILWVYNHHYKKPGKKVARKSF